MHMSWLMIVEVNDDVETVCSEYDDHENRQPITLGYSRPTTEAPASIFRRPTAVVVPGDHGRML